MFTIVTIFFLVLMSILLWSVIGGRGHWAIKSLTIPFCIWYSIAIGVTIVSVFGWPANSQVPKKFEVHYVLVQPPNKQTSSDGNIYLWLIDLENKHENSFFNLYNSIEGEPRAYKVEYSKKLHQRLNAVLEGLRKGQRFMGERGKGMGLLNDGKGKAKGKDNGKGGNSLFADGDVGDVGGGDEGDDSVGMKFYRLPPVDMIPKINNE